MAVPPSRLLAPPAVCCSHSCNRYSSGSDEGRLIRLLSFFSLVSSRPSLFFCAPSPPCLSPPCASLSLFLSLSLICPRPWLQTRMRCAGGLGGCNRCCCCCDGGGVCHGIWNSTGWDAVVRFGSNDDHGNCFAGPPVFFFPAPSSSATVWRRTSTVAWRRYICCVCPRRDAKEVVLR